MTIPWDEPATAMRHELGLPFAQACFRGTLRNAVREVLSLKNPQGDGFIIRMDDGSAEWDGQEIKNLGEILGALGSD
jgi:hypothetical protein